MLTTAQIGPCPRIGFRQLNHVVSRKMLQGRDSGQDAFGRLGHAGTTSRVRAAAIDCHPNSLARTNSDGVAIVGLVTDPVQSSAADDEDETAFWLSVPRFRESLIEADADYAAGRTYGEDEIRARYGLPPRNADGTQTVPARGDGSRHDPTTR